MTDHFSLLANGSAGTVGFILLVVVFVAVAIFFRLAAGSMDKDRIEQYLRARGCKPLEISWDPFGKGFWGEKNDRIYSVRYLDADGTMRSAWCKTNFWGGVYLSDKNPTPPRSARKLPDNLAVLQLEQENEKLREELERLKSQKG